MNNKFSSFPNGRIVTLQKKQFFSTHLQSNPINKINLDPTRAHHTLQKHATPCYLDAELILRARLTFKRREIAALKTGNFI